VCATCHAERYERWAASTHGRAGGEPTPDVVIAPFDGAPILFSDGEVVPRISPDGVYEFVIRQEGHPELVYRVDGVIGGGHMVGGGTQGFTWRMSDGTERFLPFDWSRHAARWFCNTGTRLDQGWLPITAELALADCGDWPPLRVLGTVDRFGNCQGCHGSQIITDQPVGEMYRTRFTTLRINCESCHGPGRAHVNLAQSGSLGFDAETGFASLTTLDEDESLDLCFECHALKDVVQEGHLPGASFRDYYALKFPVLGDEPFYPDFRVKTFAYQETHLSSACYLSGSMTCVSCHEPHGQAYQDEFGAPLQGRFDDGQCTSCHASKATDVERHTFHREGSEGSLCVSCHMPYLQQPEVGPGVPYARSDHTIPLPRPEYDAGLGVESACIQCHGDRSPAELQAQATEWWGVLKPHRPLIQALSEAADGAVGGQALLQPEETDPLAQFKALAWYLTRHLGPDQASLAPEVERRLRALAADDDLDVRALALASLHWTRGSEPTMHGFLVDALSSAGADEDALRRRWVLALSFLGDEARRQADGARAVLAYQKAMELLPEDARLLAAIGAALNQGGEFQQAVPYLERSLAVNPDHALTRVNLGIAQAALGDVASATETYAAAARANPAEPLAFFNLGNLYLRQNSAREAALSYERALELDPALARGHYNLALAYIRLERLGDALPRARRALELEPGNDGARQMVRDLEQAVGGE
jgi:tetratricopeptide (TPR) repeat protein